MNFSAFESVVIGRMRIDNYLLGLPHQLNHSEPIGALLDSSHYGTID